MDEIKQQEIYLSDLENKTDNLLYESSPSEIHVLIGADVADKLFTGRIQQLKSGLVSMETHLGWTVLGKFANYQESKDSTNLVMSLLVKEAKISDLWTLDTLGILDPGVKKSREDLEKSAQEHFERNLKFDGDGRYEVNLSWIQGHPPLPSCRNMAERRLKTWIESVKKIGQLEAYEAGFNEWLDEGIIMEEVDTTVEVESKHYLPHRAVIKKNSKTQVCPVFDGSAKEKSSPSINDCLEKGSSIVELIPSLLNRFRLK